MFAAARTLAIDTARRVLPSPMLTRLRSLAVRRLGDDPRDVFAQIHQRNIWGYQESVSGAGSTLSYTESLRRTLPDLVRELDVRTLLDVPCGDFNWMREVDLPVERYIGGDIVPALIAETRSKYGRPDREFRVLDLCQDPLPSADLLLCRDCFMHLSEDMIFHALANILRSDISLVLLTTYPQGRNRAIRTGDWFPVNLCQAPFGLPAPRQTLDDWKPPFDERCLGLWEVDELRRWAQASGHPRLDLS